MTAKTYDDFIRGWETKRKGRFPLFHEVWQAATKAVEKRLACPWANDGECGNVNIKCGECTRDPMLEQRKDYAK